MYFEFVSLIHFSAGLWASRQLPNEYGLPDNRCIRVLRFFVTEMDFGR